MKNNNRREFLRKSIIGISGAALIPGAIKGNTLSGMSNNPVPELPVRVLGRTGIKTPLISMGAAEATEPGFVKSRLRSRH